MLRTPHLAITLLIANCAFAATVLAQPSFTKPSAADCSTYTSIPLPAEAAATPVPKTPPSCASYRSYRGIGRPINYAEARACACAWKERLAQQADLDQNPQEPTTWFVGGSLILADLYINGDGVQRNIPLAMRFACESDEGMARLALPEIAKLSTSPQAHPGFEFCHYASITVTESLCTSYGSQIDDDHRARYYHSLESSMSPEQRAAFDNLLAAQRTYVETHTDEVYQGGTIHAIRNLGSQWIVNELFHTEILHFERKRWPQLSDSQIATAEALLRREYQKKIKHLQSNTKDDIEDGAVTAEHLAHVEKSWEQYRDAWTAFSQLRYPANAAAIRTQITLDRYRLLKTI